MKTPENALFSSSSRRETLPEINHSVKTVGCMSGIFQFVCKYQPRRKFLTSVRKHDKTAVSPMKQKPVPENMATEMSVNDGKRKDMIRSLEKNTHLNCDFRRFSCDVPRSPTLSSDIRRANSVSSQDNLRRSPVLVARLMGLDQIPASSSPESTDEKRRKLLGALEKCDEDLKALKKIIESVRSGENFRSPAPDMVGLFYGATTKRLMEREVKVRASPKEVDGEDCTRKEKRRSDFNAEQPSPVSVLDEISYSSSPASNCRRNIHKNGEHNKKLREDSINLSFFHKMTIESLPRLSRRQRGDNLCEYFSSQTRKPTNRASSKAMIESVNEVCQDLDWGEGWELGRIGLVLQDDIFGELIEEIVRELGCYYLYSLPFEACKRRLCF